MVCCQENVSFKLKSIEAISQIPGYHLTDMGNEVSIIDYNFKRKYTFYKADFMKKFVVVNTVSYHKNGAANRGIDYFFVHGAISKEAREIDEMNIELIEAVIDYGNHRNMTVDFTHIECYGRIIKLTPGGVER